MRVPDPGVEGAASCAAGGDEREARRDALAYAAGAVVGTGALGAALLAIRAAGAEAGWAFQLQDPRTIMLLLLLAIAITANLLGVFELPVLAAETRPAGSFGTGALAAFVATPCAGPFLGAALGTALLLAARRIGAGVRRARAWPGDSVPAGRLHSRAAEASCRSPGRGWNASSASSRFRWRRARCGCLWLLYRLSGQDGLIAAVGLVGFAPRNPPRLVGFAQRRGRDVGIAVAAHSC